tara:strand:+ start:10271 stop:10456 length:186 start_codon:yes stop_codon:yes gene_type:complete
MSNPGINGLPFLKVSVIVLNLLFIGKKEGFYFEVGEAERLYIYRWKLSKRLTNPFSRGFTG